MTWRGSARSPAFITKAGLRLARGLLLAALLMLVLPGQASAHAELMETNPANGALLTRAPTEIRMKFSESVFLVPDGVRLLGQQGALTGQDDVKVVNDSEVVVKVPDLGTGVYTVSWRVVSEDSHPIKGAFVFGVGAVDLGALPQTGAQEDDLSPLAVVFGVFRWLGYAALALLGGGVLFLVLCWPSGGADRRMRRLLVAGWCGGLVSALGVLALQGPTAAGRALSDVVDPALLGATLSTGYGWFVLARILLLLLGGAVVRVLVDEPRDGVLRALAVLTLVVALPVTWHGTGHANASGLLPAVLNVAHLIAMCAWLGGLAALVWCTRGLTSVEPVTRFSRVALVSVAVLAVTGLGRAWVSVGSFSALTGSDYGILLVAKLAVLATTLWLASLSRAAVRRWTAVPVGSARMVGEHEAVARRQLTWTVRGEAAGAAVVLVVTTLLVATPPATRPVPTGPAVAEVAIGDVRAGVELAPAKAGANVLTVRPGKPGEVSASLSLPDRGVGPLKVKLTPAGDGTFVSENLIVPMAGTWKAEITVGRQAAEVELRVR